MGMVKKSEGKEKTIQFAPGGNCSGWVTIPIELIEDVEILKVVPCKDHAHPLVRLNLKTPTTPEAKILSSILNAMQSSLEGTQLAFAGQLPAFAGRLPAFAGRLPAFAGRLPAFAGRPSLDPWGDPVCGPGLVKRCGPLNLPGGGWSTVCWCEPPFNPNPEGFLPYYAY